MKKVILIDGNNLLFRSYYATAYTGNMMKNSKGFPTNALFGFVNMMNKIIKEEKPEYIVVALDKGKTFRHDKFKEYKEGRMAVPDELIKQFPIAKDILKNMGITYLEIDNYEADDIIGTISNKITIDDDYDATIISSDKDLLQLIAPDVDVKLLKTKDYIRMNRDVFYQEYGIEPIKMIDLKGLQGDPSDNIPGVKGIGEKTALKLLKEYGSIEGVYASIDKISGSVKEKLINDKEKAFMSKELATIYKEVPLNIDFNDIKYKGTNKEKLNKVYEELEFYSFLKKNNAIKKDTKVDVTIVRNIGELKIKEPCSVYLELSETNYHKANILGMGLYDGENSYFISFSILKENPSFLTKIEKYTYDYKKMIVSLKWHNINISNVSFDLMLASYLLNYNVKDDISYLANSLDYDIPFFEIYKKNQLSEKEMANIICSKAKFIYEVYDKFMEEIKKEEQITLLNDIEMPLSIVLADMEYTGVCIDKKVLNDMGEEIKIKLELISKDIYNNTGVEFNISSPKQLGEILFNKLKLPTTKKGKTGYSTEKDVLLKLKDKHPIINMILEYRTLTKLHSNYIVGLLDSIMEDGKIHNIYNQTLTRTGRLSSSEPNIQNIPIRENYGRLIRKAFVPSKNNIMMGFDYSQIELRILAHLSGVKNLIDAFNKELDIHTKTASEIFGVLEDRVTKEMRRRAKAVNFGIIYGISSFGLSENLDIDVKEAKIFIDKYLDSFPGVKKFMDKSIKTAYEKGYVKTIMNRKRVIDELNNKNIMIKKQGERMALNMPIQGSNADIIKKAMVEIYDKFNQLKLRSKMIIQVHDELIFDVDAKEEAKIRKIVTDIMEHTYKLSVPLKVEVEVGVNWYETK
ncbi:MAG: DNA polymerase I [Bacilli bacterium]